MHWFVVNLTQIGAGMNRPAPAGLALLRESSPRRAADERRAFGAKHTRPLVAQFRCSPRAGVLNPLPSAKA